MDKLNKQINGFWLDNELNGVHLDYTNIYIDYEIVFLLGFANL